MKELRKNRLKGLQLLFDDDSKLLKQSNGRKLLCIERLESCIHVRDLVNAML